jgi:hypothetical protein
MRLSRLLLLAPLLSSCGLIPLPEQTGTDFEFVNTVGFLQPAQVAYMDVNQLEYLTIPKLPYREVTFEAQGSYRGRSKQLRVQLFALDSRPNCPLVIHGDGSSSGALLCDGQGGGKYLTEVLLLSGQSQPIFLKNPILDQAVRGGTLYLGARILEGELSADERVNISSIRFRGRL